MHGHAAVGQGNIMADGGATGPDHALERLVFFSDAVFAIAITLLIIEVHPPHLPWGAPWQSHVDALLRMLPTFFGFFVSFFVIGAFWAAHHRAFAMAAHYSERLVAPNLQLLCAIVFMPFATAYMSTNPGMLVPSILYALSQIAAGLLQLRLVRLTTLPSIVRTNASAEQIAYVRMRGGAVVLGALLSLALAFVWAPISQTGLLTIPLWRWLLALRVKRRFAAA